jgi:O-antigen ligase
MQRKRYKPDLLVYVTVAFLWVSVWRFQDLWPIIGKIQVPILLEILLCAILATSFSGPRSLKWVRSRVFAIPFLLLLLMIAGVPESLWPGKSVTFITKDFGPSILLMVGVTTSLRNADDINWIAFAHLVGATIYSTYIYLFIPVGSGGRLGSLVYYDANDFALLVVSSIPFAIYFLRPVVPAWKRFFALFSLVLFVEMVLKSGSRGGFIAFVLLMTYVVIAFRAIPARLRLSAVAVALLFMTVFGSAAYWAMMKTILHPKDDYNMKEETGRKFIWKRGIVYMITHPVLGVGADTFEQAEGTLSPVARAYAAEHRGIKWSTAHNSYVLVGAEMGAGGMVLFVTMIATTFNHLLRIKEDPDDPYVTAEDAAFAQTLIASLIGFCVAGFFVSASYFSFLYALIGLAVAEDSLRRRRRASGGSSPPLKRKLPARRTQVSAAQAPATHWAPG